MDTPQLIRSLRARVNQANHLLTPGVYGEIVRLFDACALHPGALSALRAHSPEYGRREFLLNVEQTGRPVAPPDAVLGDVRARAAKQPDWENWFQEGRIDGRPVLLIARWLCHLAGFCHRTVQLFLDHPTEDGYTLLQVRGLDKAEAPGCFDLPCAGHVSGLETIEGALFVELEEELGLDRADVSPPKALGRYVYRGDEEDPLLRNVEFRTVYRSRLQAGALSRIRFVDGEVAAVALFAVPEVQRLIELQPERVASGLAGSWGLYG